MELRKGQGLGWGGTWASGVVMFEHGGGTRLRTHIARNGLGGVA